jgi:excisionase family DNA binding protein
MSERVLTVRETAKLLRISEGVAYEAVRAGRIPAVRVGARRWVVPRDRLERELLGGDVERNGGSAKGGP